MGRWQTLRHRSRWLRVGDARVDAWLEVRMAVLPVFAEGAGRIVACPPDSSRLTLAFRAECDLPLVGRRAARLFAVEVRRVLDEDFAFTVDHLRTSSGGVPGAGDARLPGPP